MIKVKFFTLLRLMLNIKEIEVDTEKEEITIREVLNIAEKKIGKPFLYKMLNKDGEIMRGTIILINGKNILHINKLDSVVHNKDIVSLFPPGGGG